ncbi:hypothetical protein H4219_003257 [Mycoemilia scoparia]|uniref:Uncharacterized protein n=1 Tax=Mycoemilia scoparia TaxID=417184 RepID=A0A9W7ZVE0_9FUNG|nr:hypothetical protein H4219_003257 [Mycoemilia scoparia]
MTRNFTTWVSFTVALNLQLVICHNIRDTQRFEPYYYAVPAVIAIVPFTVTISAHSVPDIVVSDYCFSDNVINPLPYGLYWPRGIVYTLAGIVASLCSIAYILAHVFRSRMVVLREGNRTFEQLEGRGAGVCLESEHKAIIDRVNQGIAIQEPKTALIPPDVQFSLVERVRPLSSPLDEEQEDDGAQSPMHHFYHPWRYGNLAIRRFMTESTTTSTPIRYPDPAYHSNSRHNNQLLRRSLTSDVPTRLSAHLSLSSRQQHHTPRPELDEIQEQLLEESQLYPEREQEQSQQQGVPAKLQKKLQSAKRKLSTSIKHPIEVTKEMLAKYRIISPLLLRLLWVPLAPLFSFFIEVAANTVGAHSAYETHEWLHGLADGMLILQALIQAYPFYTDTIIVGTFKSIRVDMISKYLYRPSRELIMESFGDDDLRKAQFRKLGNHSNIFSRERQDIPSARPRRANSLLSITSLGASGDDDDGDGDGDDDDAEDEGGGVVLDGHRNIPPPLSSRHLGEVETAILDLWKFTAGIRDGDGRRQASLIPRFKNIKYRLKFYFVRYVLLTRGERRVYKMVFGPNRDNSDAQDI